MKDYELDAAKLQALDKLVDALSYIFDSRYYEGPLCPFCGFVRSPGLAVLHHPNCEGDKLERVYDDALRLDWTGEVHA
jgi:hypothetical protein